MRQVNHHLATRDVVFLCGLILVSESFNGQVKWMDRGFQITSCWFVFDPKIDINEQIFNKTDNIWSQKTVHKSAWSQWRCSKGAGCVIITHVAECDWIRVTGWCCYKLVITSHGPRCSTQGTRLGATLATILTWLYMISAHWHIVSTTTIGMFINMK